MATEIIKTDPLRPYEAFSRCKEVVSRGGIIVYPTDTFYGLGADPNNADAVRRLFEIKGRAATHPILLLISDAGRVGDWAAETGPEAERLMKTYWPGPLTIVFKAKESVLPLLTAGTGKIGLRVPGSRPALQLLAFVDGALTGTSANISGQACANTAKQAAEALGDRVDLVLDAGMTAGGKPSTVVDASTGRISVIRRGVIEIFS